MMSSAAVAPLDYEFGVIRLFGSADIGQRGLIEGWSYPEPEHNWNNGFDARLLLATPRPAQDCALVIEGQPMLVGPCKHQNMTLYVNGFRAGFWRLARGSGNIVEATLRPEWWITRNGTALLDMIFHLPDSAAPSDIGAANDSRVLGFCFRTLLIS